MMTIDELKMGGMREKLSVPGCCDFSMERAEQFYLAVIVLRYNERT